MPTVSPIITDPEDFASALAACEDDKSIIALLVSELYASAVQVVYGDAVIIRPSDELEETLTVSAAYLGSVQLFYRRALESDGIEKDLYDKLTGCCPYCSNIQCGMLGMKMDEEVSARLLDTVRTCHTLNKDIEASAIVYIAKNASAVLITGLLATRAVQCIGGEENSKCGKTILQLRTPET